MNLVDKLLGPIKDALCFIESSMASDNYVGNGKQDGLPLSGLVVATLAMIVFKPLALVYAYTTYLIVKGVEKITDNEGLQSNTESLVDYSDILLQKADKYSAKIGDFANTGLSCALTAFIWILALPITPIVWLVDKYTSSKVSEMKEPEQVNANDVGVTWLCCIARYTVGKLQKFTQQFQT